MKVGNGVRICPWSCIGEGPHGVEPCRSGSGETPTVNLRPNNAQGPYSGYNGLYDPSRSQGAITPALCWSHVRRQFFELADIAANARRGKKAPAISPVALEAVKRINALFDIERGTNGLSAEERLRIRQEQSAPLLADLKEWLRDERSRLSRSASVAKPIDYMLRRWDRFAHFIDDGRVCLTNNAAERALRGPQHRGVPSARQFSHRGCRRGAARLPVDLSPIPGPGESIGSAPTGGNDQHCLCLADGDVTLT